MSDLKKLWRMQRSYFIASFVVMEGAVWLGLRMLREGDMTPDLWQSIMESYGFRAIHIALCGLLAVTLFGRTLFAAGRDNREFLSSLPVKRRSWQLFTTLAGILLLVCVYAGGLGMYVWELKGKVTGGLPALVGLFGKGCAFSALEYHALILLGAVCRKCFAWMKGVYYKSLEGADER